jgi:menaquinone-specific isochorismate synthase
MEHEFVVTAVREALQPICSKLDIPAEPEVRKYPNVQHLYSPIKGVLKSKTDVLNVLSAMHPTPAVGGFPTEQSLDHIKRLEHFDRGWYAAPVGWICSSGRSEFSVAIRSALLCKNEATLYAGCGIVEGSDPEKEWHETQIKLIPMISALTHEAL